MSSHSISTFGAQIFFIFPKKFGKKISDQILAIFFAPLLFFVGLEISAGRLQELKKLLGSLDSSSFFFHFFVSLVSGTDSN